MNKARKAKAIQTPDPGTLVLQNPNNVKPKLKEVGGSNFDDFNHILLNSVANTLRIRATDKPEERTQMLQAAAATLMGLKPENELEGMLIGQMIACNAAAMECFRRAMLPDQPLVNRQTNLNFANKLSRTYALHMETLDKHRGKGQQTVRVEHVTVNAGGQAIVGNVSTGGGVTTKSKEPAHENTPAHAPEPEMRSPFEAVEEAVPERRDEER